MTKSQTLLEAQTWAMAYIRNNYKLDSSEVDNDTVRLKFVSEVSLPQLAEELDDELKSNGEFVGVVVGVSGGSSSPLEVSVNFIMPLGLV